MKKIYIYNDTGVGVCGNGGVCGRGGDMTWKYMVLDVLVS